MRSQHLADVTKGAACRELDPAKALAGQYQCWRVTGLHVGTDFGREFLPPAVRFISQG